MVSYHNKRGRKDLPPVTVVLHGSSDLGETSDVATGDQGRQDALLGGGVLAGGVETVLEARVHDALEARVDLLGSPVDAGRVLGHLQTGDGDTTGVGGLAGGVPDGSAAGVGLAVGLEDVDGLLGAAHVGALGDELAAVVDEDLGLLAGNLVLGGRGQGNVNLADVGPGAGVGDVAELVDELGGADDGGELLALDLQVGDGVDLGGGEAGVTDGDQGALAVGQRDDGTAQLDDLESGVLGDVTGAGKRDALAEEGLLAARDVLDHVVDVVDDTVAGGLGADQTATPGATLAGEDTLPGVAHLAVLAEQEADLATGDTDITGGDVSVGTDVAGQLGHEGDTEATDLAVGLALGVEVGATLTTAHVQAGQGILEDLLETEELQDGQVDGGVETETTLVGAKGGVELDTVTAVDLDVSLVILPDDAELDHTLGDGDDSESLAVLGVLLEESGVLEGRGKL